jgi:hypothetical protein
VAEDLPKEGKIRAKKKIWISGSALAKKAEGLNLGDSLVDRIYFVYLS